MSKKPILGSRGLPADRGSVSACADRQQVWIRHRKTALPRVSNFEFIFDGWNYPDIPPADEYVPAFKAAWNLNRGSGALLIREPDPDFEQELQKYPDDLGVPSDR